MNVIDGEKMAGQSPTIFHAMWNNRDDPFVICCAFVMLMCVASALFLFDGWRRDRRDRKRGSDDQ